MKRRGPDGASPSVLRRIGGGLGTPQRCGKALGERKHGHWMHCRAKAAQCADRIYSRAIVNRGYGHLELILALTW